MSIKQNMVQIEKVGVELLLLSIKYVDSFFFFLSHLMFCYFSLISKEYHRNDKVGV